MCVQSSDWCSSLTDLKQVDLFLEVEDCFGQTLDVRVEFVRLPDQRDALGDERLHLLLQTGHQQRDGHPLLHLLTGALVGADALDERDGEGIQLIGLMGFVDDGQRHAEAQPLQVTHLLGERDDLGQEVDLELEHGSGASAGARVLDGEDASGHAQVALLHLSIQ